MTTNILATILTLLVTNVAENIEQQPNYNLNYVIPVDVLSNQHWSIPAPNPIRRVTTEVYEQRLLILEAEGLHFTNVLASVRKLRTVETYRQTIPQPQWVLDPERTTTDTNPPVAFFATNSAIFGSVLIYTNWIYGTNATNILLIP